MIMYLLSSIYLCIDKYRAPGTRLCQLHWSGTKPSYFWNGRRVYGLREFSLVFLLLRVWLDPSSDLISPLPYLTRVHESVCHVDLDEHEKYAAKMCRRYYARMATGQRVVVVLVVVVVSLLLTTLSSMCLNPRTTWNVRKLHVRR